MLGIGFSLWTEHATEVDHVVAVSTIVSQHKNVWRSALVGALWGAGHTTSLPGRRHFSPCPACGYSAESSGWFEFGVALMIISLGVSALWRALRGNIEVHVHNTVTMACLTTCTFQRKKQKHIQKSHSAHSHSVSRGLETTLNRNNARPCRFWCINSVVLTQISSTMVGILYLTKSSDWDR